MLEPIEDIAISLGAKAIDHGVAKPESEIDNAEPITALFKLFSNDRSGSKTEEASMVITEGSESQRGQI